MWLLIYAGIKVNTMLVKGALASKKNYIIKRKYYIETQFHGVLAGRASAFRITVLLWGESPVTGGFPSKKAQ